MKQCRYILLMASYCSVSALLDNYHLRQDKSIFLSPVNSHSECSPSYGKYLNAYLMFLHTKKQESAEKLMFMCCVSNSKVCSQFIKLSY